MRITESLKGFTYSDTDQLFAVSIKPKSNSETPVIKSKSSSQAAIKARAEQRRGKKFINGKYV